MAAASKVIIILTNWPIRSGLFRRATMTSPSFHHGVYHCEKGFSSELWGCLTPSGFMLIFNWNTLDDYSQLISLCTACDVFSRGCSDAHALYLEQKQLCLKYRNTHTWLMNAAPMVLPLSCSPWVVAVQVYHSSAKRKTGDTRPLSAS